MFFSFMNHGDGWLFPRHVSYTFSAFVYSLGMSVILYLLMYINRNLFYDLDSAFPFPACRKRIYLKQFKKLLLLMIATLWVVLLAIS